jgi:hypothetical protein
MKEIERVRVLDLDDYYITDDFKAELMEDKVFSSLLTFIPVEELLQVAKIRIRRDV